jgi:membrane-bound serine protease (ClpP class)
MLLSSRRRCRRAFALLVMLAGALLFASTALAQDTSPVVDVLQVDGPLDARVTGHVERAIARAEEQGAEALVLELSTEGGLRRDGAELAARIEGSTVPVVVWVGPPGARVTGAGALVAQSAHVLAMAPATLLGAASPLDLADETGAADPEAMAALAEARGRDADTARAMAGGAAVIAAGVELGDLPARLEADALPWAVDPDQLRFHTDDELVAEGVADFVATELPDVLRQADGLTVALEGAGERAIDLDPVTASVRFENLGLLDRVLHAMTDPTLAYLLLIGGALAILFEVYQPGFGVAGGAGVLLVAFASYGLWALPVNGWALALLAVGLALLAVDLAIAGLGLLTVSGTAALGAGSYWLFAGPPPLRAAWWVLVLAVAFCVLYFVVIMTTVLRAQGSQAMEGAERVIGRRAVVRSMLNPEGHVFVDGALWRARAPSAAGKVKAGTPVRITGMSEDGLTLDVELVDDAEEAVANPA